MSVKIFADFSFKNPRRRRKFLSTLRSQLKMSLEISVDITLFQNSKCRWKFLSTLRSHLKMSPEISIDITFQNSKCRWKFLSTLPYFTTQNVVGNFYRHYPISKLKMSLEISSQQYFLKTVSCS